MRDKQQIIRDKGESQLIRDYHKNSGTVGSYYVHRCVHTYMYACIKSYRHTKTSILYLEGSVSAVCIHTNL